MTILTFWILVLSDCIIFTMTSLKQSFEEIKVKIEIQLAEFEKDL